MRRRVPCASSSSSRSSGYRRRRRSGGFVRIDGVWEPLIRELDVEESGKGLDGPIVLGVVQEVAHAGLKTRVPFEHVELGVLERLGGIDVSSGILVGGEEKMKLTTAPLEGSICRIKGLVREE